MLGSLKHKVQLCFFFFLSLTYSPFHNQSPLPMTGKRFLMVPPKTKNENKNKTADQTSKQSFQIYLEAPIMISKKTDEHCSFNTTDTSLNKCVHFSWNIRFFAGDCETSRAKNLCVF